MNIQLPLGLQKAATTALVGGVAVVVEFHVLRESGGCCEGAGGGIDRVGRAQITGNGVDDGVRYATRTGHC